MSQDTPESFTQLTQTQTEPIGDSQSTLEFSQDPSWGKLLPAPPMPQPKTLGLVRHSPEPVSLILNQNINLIESTYTVGSGVKCNFVIKLENLSRDVLKNISREHFMLTRDLTKPLSPSILKDTSYNGTYVNGKKVGKGNMRIIENNDVISVVLPEYKMFVFVDMKKNEQGEIPPHIANEYFISTVLGMGACGIVKLVYNKMTCEKYAMKVVQKKNLKNGKRHPLNDVEKVMNEVKILKSLQHPFIINTIEIFDTDTAVYIILELMEGGELFDFITGQTRLNEYTAKIVFRQMVLAMMYLHGQNVTHRDLKPENVLLKSKGELIVKVTDFGLSKIVAEEIIMKTMCGTPLYVAPEILVSEGKEKYDSQVDVWSLGVILFICLSGYLPFSHDYTNAPLQEQIKLGNYHISNSHWKDVSLDARRLVCKMLVVNPKERITLEEILKDNWMQDEVVIAKVDQLMNLQPKNVNIQALAKLTMMDDTLSMVKEDVTHIPKRILSQFLNPPSKRRRIENGSNSSGTSTDTI